MYTFSRRVVILLLVTCSNYCLGTSVIWTKSLSNQNSPSDYSDATGVLGQVNFNGAGTVNGIFGQGRPERFFGTEGVGEKVVSGPERSKSLGPAKYAYQVSHHHELTKTSSLADGEASKGGGAVPSTIINILNRYSSSLNGAEPKKYETSKRINLENGFNKLEGGTSQRQLNSVRNSPEYLATPARSNVEIIPTRYQSGTIVLSPKFGGSPKTNAIIYDLRSGVAAGSVPKKDEILKTIVLSVDDTPAVRSILEKYSSEVPKFVPEGVLTSKTFQPSNGAEDVGSILNGYSSALKITPGKDKASNSKVSNSVGPNLAKLDGYRASDRVRPLHREPVQVEEPASYKVVDAVESPVYHYSGQEDKPVEEYERVQDAAEDDYKSNYDHDDYVRDNDGYVYDHDYYTGPSTHDEGSEKWNGHGEHSTFSDDHGNQEYESDDDDHEVDNGHHTVYDHEDDDGHYSQGGANHADDFDEANSSGEHSEFGEAQKESKFGEKGGHKKGEKTTGYHNKSFKDEYKKDHKFYGHAKNDGFYTKDMDYDGQHHSHSDDHKRGDSHDSSSYDDHFGKKDFDDVGHLVEDDVYDYRGSGHDTHHDRHASYEHDGDSDYDHEYHEGYHH